MPWRVRPIRDFAGKRALRSSCIGRGKVLAMTGQGDGAAAGGDRLRAAHADREQAIEQLKTAFADGRLTKAEFDTRADRALSARTYADLATLTADIPAVPVDPPAAAVARPPYRRRRRPLLRAAAGSSACLLVAIGAARVASRLDPGATPTPYDYWAKYFLLIAVLAVIAAVGILARGVSNSVNSHGAFPRERALTRRLR
jgi:hypothetical protein